MALSRIVLRNNFSRQRDALCFRWQALNLNVWVLFLCFIKLVSLNPEANKIPIIGKGKQWMAVVSVEDLAEYVWQLVEVRTRGIFHPKLISRCRQKDFALAVQQVTKKQIQKLGRFSLLRMEKQMRESILASIKLDDGEGNQSESDSAKIELKNAIKDIYSGFS